MSVEDGKIVHIDKSTQIDKITSGHIEIVRGLEPVVSEMLNTQNYLLPVERIWQPSKYLPNLECSDWQEGVNELRERAFGLSDDLLVVLIGNTITEEALPSYQTWLNRGEAIRDLSGADKNGWAKWSRGWTAEENRHGDVLSKYLYLSGRVYAPAIEKTTQSLLANGFDTGSGTDPYEFFVYGSFQERATRISHNGVARLAREAGADDLGRICGAIAGDESRHEKFYTDIMGEIFKTDPEGAIIAFNNMLEGRIVMPAALMTEGESLSPSQRQSDLFRDYALVAQTTGVYTAINYVDITQHLRERWGTDSLSVSGEAAKAQESLGRFTNEYGEKLNRVMDRAAQKEPIRSFPWIRSHNETVIFENPSFLS